MAGRKIVADRVETRSLLADKSQCSNLDALKEGSRSIHLKGLGNSICQK